MKHHPVAVGGGGSSNGAGGGESPSAMSATSTPKKVTRSIMGSITRSASKGTNRGTDTCTDRVRTRVRVRDHSYEDDFFYLKSYLRVVYHTCQTCHDKYDCQTCHGKYDCLVCDELSAKAAFSQDIYHFPTLRRDSFRNYCRIHIAILTGSRDGSVAGSHSGAGSVNGSRNGSYMEALKDDTSHDYGKSEKGGTGDKAGTTSGKKIGGAGGVGGEAGEEGILLTVLEGLVGGLDALVTSLRGQGQWARVRVLRGRLIVCFTALATEVYGIDGGTLKI